MGADVICIKDMATPSPTDGCYSLVDRLKERIKAPIHAHAPTPRTGDMVYLMATLAGVDIVDCALSPMGNGTAQPRPSR
jgi:oxaloacetate decarboxylase alpha subunit